MVCQKVSYFDALSLDISGGGEAVSSDLCDSSNVIVLEFLSGPIPTSSTVASPKAISVFPLNLHYLFYLFGPHPSLKFFFPHSLHWVPKKFGNLGKKNFCLSRTDTPIDGVCFALPPFFILGSSNFESAKYI